MTKQELLQFDDDPVANGDWERFLCPMPYCEDKPADRWHKSLSVNGVFYHCWRCGVRGHFTDIAKEQRAANKAAKQPPSWWADFQ